MSAIVELVIDIAVGFVSDWTSEKWPWVWEIVSGICLVIGLILGLSSPSSNDRMAALTICVLTGILLAVVLFLRARRRSRAASMSTE
jgi:hypothetical protein